MTKTQTPQQSAQTIPTQNQQTKNVCADLFCIVLYCIVNEYLKNVKKLEKTHKKYTQKTLKEYYSKNI